MGASLGWRHRHPDPLLPYEVAAGFSLEAFSSLTELPELFLGRVPVNSIDRVDKNSQPIEKEALVFEGRAKGFGFRV